VGDGGGSRDPGLPGAWCTILGGTSEQLAAARARAAASEDMLVIDMPTAAQEHRVGDDYLAELAETSPDELRDSAFSLMSPRNRVDKITQEADLLS
jgi:Protein of unknown function (DUF2000)